MALDGSGDNGGVSLLDLPDHVIVENILAELIPPLLFDSFKHGKDILSAAATCTRIHALASHPLLWRSVNAVVFSRRFASASRRGFAPPPLPLGAVHCGVFALGYTRIVKETVDFVEMFRDLTDVRICGQTCHESHHLSRFVNVIASLPRLTRLMITSNETMRALDGGVKLASSGTLERLTVYGGGDSIVRFFPINSFPSLTELGVELGACVFPVVSAAIAQSCSSLVEVSLGYNHAQGCDVASFVSRFPMLRKLRVRTSAELTSDDVAPSASFPHLRELVVDMSGHVSGVFLSMFPSLVRLELRGQLSFNDDDLAAIGGMMNLEHLLLTCRGFVGDPCRQLLPLAHHPMASGRRSLRSLVLWGFTADLGEFFSSPWCSHLVDLSFVSCHVTGSTLDRFAASHGKLLSSTLRCLRVTDSKVCGLTLGHFVAALSSLERFVLKEYEKDFDVNGLIRELGSSCATFSHVTVSVYRGVAHIDVTPLLLVISGATEVILLGNFDQAAINSVANSCRYLQRLHAPESVVRPQSLPSACKYN